MPSLKLQSSDGEIFQVDTQIAKQSNTIRTMLEGRLPIRNLFYFISTTFKQNVADHFS